MITESAPPQLQNLEDLHNALGRVPLNRIRMHPFPGSATEEDLLSPANAGGVTCELVDGVLVEKAMGTWESSLAVELILILGRYVKDHDLGKVFTEGGLLKLAPGLIRAPDVSFVSWSQFPGRRRPKDAIYRLFPDLAVEILSINNTEAEMERKRHEYFAAGTRLVWCVDPRTRTARVYTSPTDEALLTEDDDLDGADVLPGFRLRLGEWLDQASFVEE